MLTAMVVQWDDATDSIIAGDAAAGFAYVTPAKGVVIVPMAPLGLRDREAGTVTLTSSLGLPKKLARLRSDPSVAVSYHAREFSDSSLPWHVLVQGRAEVGRPDRAWLESITPQWDKHLGKRHGGPLGRLLDIYYWQRVPITVHVVRVLVWDGTSPTPRVVGEPLPADAPAQKPPKQGTAPRVDAAKVAADVARLPHAVLSWVGGDGLPMVARVESDGTDASGARLISIDASLPPGGRRAGLTAHMFRRHMVGQEQRIHTGWLEVAEHATYAPHTRSGYALPASSLLAAVGAAIGMRLGYRQAKKLGLVEPT
jgi:hypothetical protein